MNIYDFVSRTHYQRFEQKINCLKTLFDHS